MGVWTRQVVPRVADRALDAPELRGLRQQACAELAGEVLELGFGSGLNVPHYPPAVRRVAAVEPSDVGWRLAAHRVSAATVPVQHAGLDGQALPFADGTFDAALSTFSLCTIPDAVRALQEVRRVLRPGARLRFVEHGRAPDEDVRRWQRRLDPVSRLLQGGCRLGRPIDVLLERAGFVVEQLERSYLPGTPRPFGHLYQGTARA